MTSEFTEKNDPGIASSSGPPPTASALSREDEEHLHLLSIFHYVVAVIGGLIACIPLIHVTIGAFMAFCPDIFADGHPPSPPPQWVGFLFMAIGLFACSVGWGFAIALAFAGRCLARRRYYYYCFVLAALACSFFPFGTVLGVFTIIVLCRPAVRAAFESAALR